MHTNAKRTDIARAAGVSESTVSRALANSPLISAEIRQKVREIAAEFGYVPSRQAALFTKNKTCRLGFVVRSYKVFPSFSRPYYPSLLDGAVRGAEEHGYFVTIILDRKEKACDLALLVKSREIDGLLITIPSMDDPRFDELRSRNVPCVLVNDYRDGFNCVDGKPDAGMRKALEHSVSLGHRRIGFITGDMHYRNAIDRLAVFNRLAREFGIDSSTAEGNFSRTSGYRCAGKLLRDGNSPTLIMASCDREAIGVIDYCREHGLHVPGDVSVIGYDNLDPASDVTPALSTVDNQVMKTGWEAARLLCEILEGQAQPPITRWLDTDFVIRQSIGPCKNQQRSSV
jgi:DNA-binding LacI/PurR family transcriptional regulator